MKELKIEISICSYQYAELEEPDRNLIDAAKKATENSYSPYSHFRVGASVLLANGEVITGSNQENAAYPSGLCAERTALFYAGARYPNESVKTLAIAGRDDSGFTESPISPCGACLQVLMETEQRHKQPMRILLYGEKQIFLIEGVRNLLPLSFGADFLQ